MVLSLVELDQPVMDDETFFEHFFSFLKVPFSFGPGSLVFVFLLF
jgi:hypothetical protein